MAKRRKYSELNSLKGRIREKNTSYRKLSEGIGMAVNTLSDKINGFYAMSIPEAEAIPCFWRYRQRNWINIILAQR
ncbi:MAG: hypothetical protein M0T74_05610 [Desulfitobacterium hafniense]|nr:hypothetical protein [Desulfitobacterium hafniense]